MITNLDFTVASINGISFLKESYCDAPFKLANITEDKKDPVLRLMLASSSPGILDADQYKIKISLQQNSIVQLHTQSYQRLFSMKQKAEQETEIHLETGSSFCFIPHPVVPHKLSNFRSSTNIYLGDDCNLIFGEVLTCGRKLNGEVFSFSKYHNGVNIFLNNRLIVKENLLIEPATIDVNEIGQLQGYTHQATLIFLNEKADSKALIVRLHELLKTEQGISFGASCTAVNGVMLRILGQKAEQLFNCLRLIAGEILSEKKIKAVEYGI